MNKTFRLFIVSLIIGIICISSLTILGNKVSQKNTTKVIAMDIKYKKK